MLIDTFLVGEILLAIVLTLALVFTYLAMKERDLVKAIIYSAVEAIAFALAYTIMFAPDIVLAYIAVGVGIYSVVFLYVAKRTEREERE